MDPITIAAIASAVGALSKAGLAAAQNAKSKKLANQPRPVQQVPDAVKQATATTQMAYNNPNMIGQTMAETNLRSNAADANYALQQQGGNTNAVTAAIAGNTNKALNDLYQQYVGRKDNLRGQLVGQLNQQGAYEQNNFEVNKMQPYLDAMKASAMQKGAATQNLGGAITDVVGGLTSIGGIQNSNNQNAALLSLLGGKGTNLPSGTIASIAKGMQSVGRTPATLPSTQLPSTQLPSVQLSGVPESTGISPNDLAQIQSMIDAQNAPNVLQKNGLTAASTATTPLNIPKSFEKKAMSAISGMSSDELLELAKTPDGLKTIQALLQSMGLLNQPQ